MKLSNNTILITGGASGIGFELASQFLALKNTVLITGRDQGRLDVAKAKLPGVHTFASDASNAIAIGALFDKVTREYPALNVLINNAGIMHEINLQTAKPSDDLCAEIETNLNGPIRMIQRFLPHLKNQPEAAIMNVSSGLAFVPLPTSPAYCATKAGLHSFTLSLRVQLKNTKVKVFELAPPATDTPLLDQSHPEDFKGIRIMSVAEMVQRAIKGFENDEMEIRPGPSNQLKLMNRIAPQFILDQLSKPVDRMLAESGPAN
jgi:uncharacterized oxidoreductase